MPVLAPERVLVQTLVGDQVVALVMAHAGVTVQDLVTVLAPAGIRVQEGTLVEAMARAPVLDRAGPMVVVTVMDAAPPLTRVLR